MAATQSDTVHVHDTRVKGKKGLLHFDVMSTDEATALRLASNTLQVLEKLTCWSRSRSANSATASRSWCSHQNSNGNSMSREGLS